MIIGEVKRVIRGSNSLRVARSIRDTAYKVLQARSRIEAEKDDVATMAEIAETLAIPECEVVYALDAISDPVSLYDPVYNKNGDTLLVMDQISDERNTDERWTENVALERAISSLGEREKENSLYALLRRQNPDGNFRRNRAFSGSGFPSRKKRLKGSETEAEGVMFAA